MGIQITEGYKEWPALSYNRVHIKSFLRQQDMEPPYKTRVKLEYVLFAFSPDTPKLRLFDESAQGVIEVDDYVATFMEKLQAMTPEEQEAAIALSLAADTGYGQLIQLMGTKNIKTTAVR